MKLNEFLVTHNLELKIFVCSNGEYRVCFDPLVEIKEGVILKSDSGDSSPDLITAINNTLDRISYKTLKVDKSGYIKVLEVTL